MKKKLGLILFTAFMISVNAQTQQPAGTNSQPNMQNQQPANNQNQQPGNMQRDSSMHKSKRNDSMNKSDKSNQNYKNNPANKSNKNYNRTDSIPKDSIQ
jgi:hypothetical protein